MSAELQSRGWWRRSDGEQLSWLLVALAACPWREPAVCRTGRSVQMHTPVWLVVLADLVGVDASIWSAIGAASGVIGPCGCTKPTVTAV